MPKILNNSRVIDSPFEIMKCAEVFCQNEEKFSIVCIICEIKLFEFDEFQKHFKNNHFEKSAKTTDNNYFEDQFEVMEMETEIKPEMAQTDDEEDENVLTKAQLLNVLELKNDAYGDEENEEYYASEDIQSITISETNTFDCSKCGRKYKLKSSLQKHMKENHQTTAINYECDNCGKTYKSSSSLRMHYFVHTGQRSFVCPVADCGKTFYNPKGLISHKRYVHSEVRDFVCDVCGHSTNRKYSLDLHKRTHSEEKPYICKTCNKGFRTTTLLRGHQAVHSSDRPHSCETCNATFSSSNALYHHKNLHLDIKKYVCKLCGKSYAQAAGLNKHKRQHEKI